MAAKKRRRHVPEFKAQVALEAYKGDKTISQLASWPASMRLQLFRLVNGSDSCSKAFQRSLAEQGQRLIKKS